MSFILTKSLQLQRERLSKHHHADQKLSVFNLYGRYAGHDPQEEVTKERKTRKCEL